MPSGQFCRLETLSSLHDGYRKEFRVAGRQLLLLQLAGQLFLIESRCPHQGNSLYRATLSGTTIRCPKHGLEFDLITGGCTSETGCAPLQRFEPVYEGNAVGVLLDTA